MPNYTFLADLKKKYGNSMHFNISILTFLRYTTLHLFRIHRDTPECNT